MHRDYYYLIADNVTGAVVDELLLHVFEQRLYAALEESIDRRFLFILVVAGREYRPHFCFARCPFAAGPIYVSVYRTKEQDIMYYWGNNSKTFANII